MTLQISQLIGFGTGVGRPAALYFIRSDQTTSDGGGALSFTSGSFGTQDGDSVYIACAFAGEPDINNPITGVVIGGVSASLAVQSDSTQLGMAAIWIAKTDITSGVVTASYEASKPVGMGVYRLVNLISGTAYSTDKTNTMSPTGTTTVHVNLLPSSVAIFSACCRNSSGSAIWTGSTADWTQNIGDYTGGAHSTTPGSPLAVSVAISAGARNYMAMAGASWN